MTGARDLLQECVECIKNSLPGGSETESAWDNNSTGFYSGGPNREVNYGYDRGYGGQRDTPSSQMTSDGGSTYSNTINSGPGTPQWKPVLRANGRGPPPGMGVGNKRMGPPPSNLSQMNGMPHPQTREMGGYSAQANGMGFPANSTSQPQNQLPNPFAGVPQFNGFGQGFPSTPGGNLHSSVHGMGGFPGQPALGSANPQVYASQGAFRPPHVQKTGPSGSLPPPQPPGPMPGLRGRGPPPVRGPPLPHQNPRPSSNSQPYSWALGSMGNESTFLPGHGPPGQPLYPDYMKMPNSANHEYSVYDPREVSMDENGQNAPFQQFSDNAPEGGSFRQDQI